MKQLEINEMMEVDGGSFTALDWECAGLNILAISSLFARSFLGAAGFVYSAYKAGCYQSVG